MTTNTLIRFRTDGGVPSQEATMESAALSTIDAVKKFVLAGHAIFTVVSKKTGDRRTFKVVRAKKKPGDTRDPGWFVSLLTGPNNANDYRYLGFIYRGFNGQFVFGLNNYRFGTDAGKVVQWLLNRIDAGSGLLEQAEVWHVGRCGHCGRPLTVPESIASGIGPVCAGRDV